MQRLCIPPDGQINGLDLAIGYDPIEWIGGDYVDIVPTRDGRTLAVLADVAGHGLLGALASLRLHAMIHSHLKTGLVFPELADKLNEYLCDYSEEDSFVTMICLAIDPETGHTDYFNAGHLAPTVVDHQGRVRRLQDGINLPLGINRDAIKCQTDSIEKGDLLALFSDGWSELKDECGKTLGLDFLNAHLRSAYTSTETGHVHDVKARFETQFRSSPARYFADDDRTLLLARRLCPAPSPTCSTQLARDQGGKA